MIPGMRTFKAVLAQPVCSLDATASGALAQAVDILKRLSGHLPVPLARVRRLLLGYGSENGLPDVAQEPGDGAQARQSDGERRQETWHVPGGIEVKPARHGRVARRSKARE